MTDIILNFWRETECIILDINLLFNIEGNITKCSLILDDLNYTNDFLRNVRINSKKLVLDDKDNKLKKEVNQFTIDISNPGIDISNPGIDIIFLITCDNFNKLEKNEKITFVIKINDSIEKKGEIHFINDTMKNVSFYPLLCNTIGDNMESFMLLRTNPKLTGNIKLVVDSNYNLYLDTFKVSSNSILNERLYRHLPIPADGNYARDICKIFGKLPLGVLFDVHSEAYEPHKNYYDINLLIENIYEYGAENNMDSLYPESMKILAPLYIGKHLPTYFCIFRTDNIINNETYSTSSFNTTEKFNKLLAESTVIKIFDLRNYTTIGLYLNNYKTDILEYLAGSCYLLFIEQEYSKNNEKHQKYYRLGINTWKGISVDKGIFVNKTETTYFGTKILNNNDKMQELFNMFLLNGYSRNNILFPNIINLEFLFDDNSGEEFKLYNYFGLYLTENEFLHFSSISKSKDNNNYTVNYYDKNNKKHLFNNVDLNIVEDPLYDDRIFFMSTNNSVSNIYNTNDITKFIKQNVCNKPNMNICNIPATYKNVDDINGFITLLFNKQIEYGEHFKIILLNVNNYITLAKEHIVLEIIASNDIRLASSLNNIYPYINTNKIEDDGNGNFLSVPINLYRISFYTLDLKNHNIAASLPELLLRLAAAISSFKKYIYVGSISDNKISIISTNSYKDNNVINDIPAVYFLHIFNNKLDNITYFSNNITEITYNLLLSKEIKEKFINSILPFSNNDLELIDNKYYNIILFINVSDYDNNYFYEVEGDIYEKLKKQDDLLINTVSGFLSIPQFTISNVILKNNTQLENNNLQINDIISPFNVNNSMILSYDKLLLKNRYLSIYTPKMASLSIMGINNIKDINVYINNIQKENYNNQTSLFVKKGDKLYFSDFDNALLKYFVVYKLISGNIRNVPSGKDIKFVIIPGELMYVYKGEIVSIKLVNNYLLANENSYISIVNNTLLDTYDYDNILPILNEKNYYIDNKINSNLSIPIVPLVNCQWKSNGEYFDHDSLLNVNYLLDNYNLHGNFIENLYTLVNSNNGLYIINTLNTNIDIDGDIISFKDFIINKQYDFPLKKFLLLNNANNIAIGYYNKYVQTLEFIYYGLKFIIKFTNSLYSKDINLLNYNNYQVFIMNLYTGENTIDMYISEKEEFILIINHVYCSKELYYTSNILLLENNSINTNNYTWIKSPYYIDFANTGKINKNKDENIYIFNKSDEYTLNTGSNNATDINNIDYFILADVDIYDNNISYEEIEDPIVYGYLSTDKDIYKSYKKYDILNHVEKKPSFIFSEFNSIDRKTTNNCTIGDINNKTYLDDIYISDMTYSKKLSFLLKIQKMLLLDNSKEKTYLEKIKEYILSFKNCMLNLYIIKLNNTIHKLLLLDIPNASMTIDISLPNNIKYNNGLFNPDFVNIFEFDINDDISKKLNIDTLLGNTHINNIKYLYNYTYNKVLENGCTCINNYYVLNRDILNTNWDNNIYRIYTNNDKFNIIPGYNVNLNDKMFFGSKCIVIKNDYILIDNWPIFTNNKNSFKNLIQLQIISKYNEHSIPKNNLSISINVTLALYNTLLNNTSFNNNWNSIMCDNLSITNFINNVLLKFYNIQNSELLLYKKYVKNKSIDNIFIKNEKPSSFNEWELCTNIYTTYLIVNNEVILNIIIQDYISYMFYPIIKIYKC